MRIFVGVKIPSEIRSEIEAEADKILKHAISYKKNVSQNFHLTLKFIGEIEISDIVALDQLLAESLKDIQAFDVNLKDMGYFEKGNEYVLWIGVKSGVGYLQEIHQRIDKKISDLFQIDRSKLTPHITVARKVVVDNVKTLSKNKTKNYTFNVDEVIIYYSHRVDNVLTYTPLSKIKLL